MITRKTLVMYRPLKSISTYTGIFLLVLSPVLLSGTSIPTTRTGAVHEVSIPLSKVSPLSIASAPVISNSQKLIVQAQALYDSLKLSRAGLSKKAFEFAWRGYQYMLGKRMLTNTDVL